MDKNPRLALVEKIEAAFADVPYPAYIGSELAHLEGKHWRDITAADLSRHKDDLTNFSDEGFRFFLPAILKAVILNPSEIDTLVDNLFMFLAPPRGQNALGQIYRPEYSDFLETRFAVRSQAFTSREREAMCAFLRAYMELDPHGNWTLDDGFYLLPAIDFWCGDN